MSPQIYRYVVRHDAGTAPRPFGGMCSLAICKPRIRISAKVGDWIIGFRSRRPGEVVYAMQVTERMTLGAYWLDPRFEDRKPGNTPYPDNIYRPSKDGSLEQIQNPIHGPHATDRDTSGRNVLLSDRYWYFGKSSVQISTDLIHLVHTTQGHVVHKGRRHADLEHLADWLHAWSGGIHGGPIDGDRIQPTTIDLTSEAPSTRRLEQDSLQIPRARSTCSAAPAQPRPTKGPRPASEPRTDAPQRTGKLVISRKGFDSGYGGMPSPVLPDGRLLPLPIPAQHDRFRMEHISADPIELSAVLADLSARRHSLSTLVHLDPDLNRRDDLRMPGWRPSLGQTGTAQSHLCSQGVGIGDTFLFFGWFREIERAKGRWRYVPRAPNLHVLFGWLEVEDVLPVVLDRQKCLNKFPWIADHPHVANQEHYTDPRNNLYIAPEQSRLAEGSMGGGTFGQFSPDLCLTATGHSRSVWRLPHWFYPQDGRQLLSYHGHPDRWSKGGDTCILKSVAKGQEFVLDLDDYPEASGWLKSVVSRNA